MQALLDHPLIRSLCDETAKRSLRRVLPSYLPPRIFTLALLDTIAAAPRTATAGAAGEPGRDVVAAATEELPSLENRQLKGALESLLRGARGDLDRFRDGIEEWFDATMDRASGWYKRRTQRSLWIIAAVVAFGLNADSAQIAGRLWKDDALRASVVAEAQRAAQTNTNDVRSPETGGGIVENVDKVRALNLPIGWSFKRADPRWPDGFWGFAGKFAGLIATTVALTLGAPFWFDLLGRVSRLRGTGKPLRDGAA